MNPVTTRGVFVALSMLLVSFVGTAIAEECAETFTIDSTEYRVSGQWCGRMVDTSLVASYEDLARVPDSFSLGDSKIYIRRDARESFLRMGREALKDGVFLVIKSGYRSARYQKQVIKRRLEAGQSMDRILRYVAPPGYSDHETGRAVDLATLPDSLKFQKTAAYGWLKKNASRFGFEETYPLDTASVFPWEPWHWGYDPSADSLSLSPARD